MRLKKINARDYGKTRKDLLKAGVGNYTIDKLRKGQNNNITIGTLFKVADALEVSVLDLFE